MVKDLNKQQWEEEKLSRATDFAKEWNPFLVSQTSSIVHWAPGFAVHH